MSIKAFHVASFVPLTASLLLGSSANSNAQYDAAAQFSATSNPNGVWQYGYSPTELGAFSLYTTHGSTDVGLPGWFDPAISGNHPPYVDYNNTGSPYSSGTVSYPTGALGQHPGPSGQYSMTVFTAPASGTYSINGFFAGLDFVFPTTTDDHVVLDNGISATSLFDVNVNDFGVDHPFSLTESLTAGESVRFETGFGTNGNYIGDSTQLSVNIANITGVPEPGAYALLGSLGLTGAAFLRRRRAR